MKNRFFRSLCVLLMLSACHDPAQQSPVPSPDASKAAPVFRMSVSEAPTSLDPLKASSAYASAIVSNVYDTLYRYQLFAEPHALRANLARAMPEVSADGLVVRIRLREDAYFQDSPIFPSGKGRQVRAADMVYSLKRHFVPDNFSDGAWLWSDTLVGMEDWLKAGAKLDQELTGLRAVGEFEVQFQLKQPMPMLASTLANAYSAVLPHELISAESGRIATIALGSGPYVLHSFDASKAVLQRNPNYRAEAFDLATEGYVQGKHEASGLAAWNGQLLPLQERIEIHFLSEASAVHLGLSGDSLDLASISVPIMQHYFSPSVDLKLRPELADRFSYRAGVELGSIFVSFNMLDPEIGASKDPAVDQAHKALRCAIVDAYSWAERNEKIYSNTARLFRGVIPPGIGGFDAANDLPIYAPIEAKARLKALALKELPTLRWGSTAASEQRRSFELFRAQMLELGFPQEKIEWQSFPSFGAYLEAVNQAQVMLMDMGWQMDAPDAENILQLYYGPYKAPQVNNANYQNPVFDAKFEQLRRTSALTERNTLAAELNQLLIDDCVVLSGASRRQISVWKKPWQAWPDSQMMVGRMLRFIAWKSPKTP